MAVLTCPHLKRKLFYARVIKKFIKYLISALRFTNEKRPFLVSDSTWFGIR